MIPIFDFFACARRLAIFAPRSAVPIHCYLFCDICAHSGPLLHCSCVVHGGVAYGMFTRVADGWRNGGRWRRLLRIAQGGHGVLLWGLALFISSGRGCVWLGDGGGGGVQLSHPQESLPVLIIFYFPRQCMQCKGFDDSIAAFLTAGGISSSFLLARWEEAILISIDWEVYLFFDTFLLI